MLLILLFSTTLFLAYCNGANDSFKGVATLYGSNTVNYRSAITIATIATFAGSVCAIFLAQEIVANFSGKGLVPQITADAPGFLMAVGFGAAATVLVATHTGFPISTTHSLVGALLGAGLMAVGSEVNLSRLGATFFLPLLVSPLIALVLGALVYLFFTSYRKYIGYTKETCICIGETRQMMPLRLYDSTMTNTEGKNRPAQNSTIDIVLADNTDCTSLYTDKFFGINLQKLLDAAHVFSAATVSFARGLNDTPKIAGLLVAAGSINLNAGMAAIAAAMAIGGLLSARRVAETMSHQITELNHGQGFSANLVTGFLVIFASKLGVPVSTTHVSVGSIFGIGLISGKRNAKMIRQILLSWLITLPTAMVFSGVFFWCIA